MSTPNFIVLASLTKIGKNSPLKAAKAEDILTGLDALASLLQTFETQNIILNTQPIETSTGELGESLDVRNAIINILAIEIATNYDNGQVIVSQTLQRSANTGMAFLKKWYTQDSMPLRRISSTAPLGAGNERYGRRARRFFGPFRILEEPRE